MNHAGLRAYIDDGGATIAFPCGDVRARRIPDLPEAAVAEHVACVDEDVAGWDAFEDFLTDPFTVSDLNDSLVSPSSPQV